MDRYVGITVEDPFDQGWLRTGDLGYLAGGELFITGRAKDIVISYGRNYAPEDFEWAAALASGVRAGRCVAFTAPGGRDDEVVIVVEPARGADPVDVERDVRRKIWGTTGLAPHRVLVVRPGTVTKMTSGKLRRAALKAALAEGRLAALVAPTQT